MHHTFHQRAAEACALLLGADLNTLLAPIEPGAPAGASLRANSVYRIIADARRADDDTLPMGPWQRELKRADWDRVSALAVSALSRQSKDLQIAAWLLEAQIHKNGFAALAAVLYVIQQLCDRYWDTLYPVLRNADMDNDGLEHRANIFRWMDEKLPPALRQVPLAGMAPGPRYGYADWERARRQDQLRLDAEHRDGATSADLAEAIGATPTAFYVALDGDLDAALVALGALTATIAPYFDGHPPGFGKLDAALRQIRALAGAELHARGARPAPATTAPVADAAAQPMAAAPSVDRAPIAPAPVPPDGVDTIRDRAHAYAVLQLAADFLARAEPHSPVPYLLRHAVSWGHMNADALYEEVFLRRGGQLNIFSDVMGLDVASPPDQAPDGNTGQPSRP